MTKTVEETVKAWNEYWEENGKSIGLCTDPADFEVFEENVKKLYKFRKLKEPVVIRAESPFHMVMLLADICGEDTKLSVNGGDTDLIPEDIEAYKKYQLKSINKARKTLEGVETGGLQKRKEIIEFTATNGSCMLDTIREKVTNFNECYEEMMGNRDTEALKARTDCHMVRMAVISQIKFWTKAVPEITYAIYRGQFESYWTVFYKFFEEIMDVDFGERAKVLDAWAEVNSTAAFWWPFTGVVFVCDRPTSIGINNNVFHKDLGPALGFRDGTGIWRLNGVKVDKEIITTPSQELDAKLIHKYTNAEIRREIVRKIGVEKLCADLNAESVDSDGDYELLLLDLGDGRKRPYLKMKNPSINTYHVEGVAPEIRTVKKALEWRNSTTEKPEQLT